MSSLRDQLLKLGLVDDRQARKADHDKRRDHKQRGRAGVESDRAARSAVAGSQAQARRAADRARERDRGDERARAERREQAAQILETGRVKPRSGRRRFYYEARGGAVPYLELDDRQAGQLDAGTLALCEPDAGGVVLVDAEAAARVAALCPEWPRTGRA